MTDCGRRLLPGLQLLRIGRGAMLLTRGRAKRRLV